MSQRASGLWTPALGFATTATGSRLALHKRPRRQNTPATTACRTALRAITQGWAALPADARASWNERPPLTNGGGYHGYLAAATKSAAAGVPPPAYFPAVDTIDEATFGEMATFSNAPGTLDLFLWDWLYWATGSAIFWRLPTAEANPTQPDLVGLISRAPDGQPTLRIPLDDPPQIMHFAALWRTPDDLLAPYTVFTTWSP